MKWSGIQIPSHPSESARIAATSISDHGSPLLSHTLKRIAATLPAVQLVDRRPHLGPVAGGFVPGAGWLTSEELWWNEAGKLQTHAPSTYKIPTCSDLAPEFNVTLLQNAANREDTIYRSKAVGEPPLMLAISVFQAIRDAIATEDDPLPALDMPATPEAVLRALGGLPA